MEQSTVEGIKVTWDKSCDNAPKRHLIKQFIVALNLIDEGYILENSTNEIIWDKVGNTVIRGQADFMQAVMDSRKSIIEINIKNIITHGNTGSAEGIILTENGSYAFCHVYTFSSGKASKIKLVTSYDIPLLT